MQDNSTIIDEDYIVTQLMRLIVLSEQHGLDLDLLMTEATSWIENRLNNAAPRA